jgi:hypothetical protein
MTNIFISHSSYDNKIAKKLDSWLRDFQLIANVWIDIRELRPGMKLEESNLQGIDRSNIVIILVSKKSKDSPWVKQEIEYSSRYAEKGEKIVIPVLYKITPNQIPVKNSQIMSLLERLYISLDENLFSIHKLIPSLIPNHYVLEVLLDGSHTDQTLLINSLRGWSDDKKLYVLINHEEFDKDLIAVLEESIQSEYSREGRLNLDRIKDNFLPIYWINISYVLSIYVMNALSNGISYESLSRSISNLVQELFIGLSRYLLGDLYFSFVDNNKRKLIKEMLKEQTHYLMPIGNYEGGLWLLCKLYYDSIISPHDLIKLSFIGNDVNRQIAFVSVHRYRGALQYFPTSPLNEIYDSDWYEVIVPQFLSYFILKESRRLKIINETLIKPIGLRLRDYTQVHGVQIG